jgi:hypothetical protein
MNFIVYTAQTEATIHRRKFERKIVDVLVDLFGFIRGTENRDAVIVLTIISQRTLYVDEELFTCFVAKHKSFDCLN